MTKKMNDMGFPNESYKELSKIWALLNCNSRKEQDEVLAYYENLEKEKNYEFLNKLKKKELEEIINNFNLFMDSFEVKK